MKTLSWQLKIPADAIIFDCDGTLSAIEGIDELAKKNHVADVVTEMTAAAMGKLGMNIDLYEKRLNLVLPSKKSLQELGQEYFDHQVEDIYQVIQVLKRLNKAIYIVSAGLSLPVKKFGEMLQIPEQNIFAVDIQFDAQGNYVDFDRASPLVTSTGKRDIVEQIKKQHPHLIYVGDGLNDVAVMDLVMRFVGYGGIFYRENIAALCEYYIRTPSMTALLPLILTAEERVKLLSEEQALYNKGLAAIKQ